MGFKRYMHFVYPYFLLFELLLAPLALFFAYRFREKRRALERFADPALLARLSSANGTRRWLKATLVIGALFFIIIALARPQFGAKLVSVQRQGADVVIAVDVSASMLAQDMKPNRLERAKALLSQLALQLQGNRVGILAFAGTAFWQCPLTLDISSVNLFLQIMDANLIPLPGTALGSAIRLATAGLSKTPPKSKAIVLLTDGEDHKSDAAGAAREAAQAGIKIYTIGLGNPSGEPIPVYDAGGAFKEYKKNKKGEVVMSKLDETLLAQIADDTGGAYFRAQDGYMDVGRLIEEIRGLEKQKLSSSLHRSYEDRYQYFLFMGLLLLMAEFFIPATRRVL